ncbi:MAG: cyclic nucleotide-binding domain-containing protein [Puniceicoccales bacterium]
MHDSEKIESILHRVSFLGALGPEQRRDVYGYMDEMSVEKGDWIETKGKPATNIYIIQSGVVHLMIHRGEQMFYKRDFRAGDSFGEAAMLSLVNNTATFIAAEPCELLVISNKGLRSLHKQKPEVFSLVILNIARDLARKLQYTDEMLPKES